MVAGRRIAQHTMLLPGEGAAQVDRRLAAVAHKVGVVATEKLCQEALDTSTSTRPRNAARGRGDTPRGCAPRPGRPARHRGRGRGVGHRRRPGFRDRCRPGRRSPGSERLPPTPLDVRRSQAVGVIARHYLGDLLNAATAVPGRWSRPRRVAINVHLRDQDTGRCDTTRAPISVEQVKGWCTHPDTQVDHPPSHATSTSTSGSTPTKSPTDSTDQVTERDGTCVHPWCTRPATSCDDDHCIPYDHGGPTSSDNIAPLCRRHHRTKTHRRWRYRFLRPGHYLWTSPGPVLLPRRHRHHRPRTTHTRLVDLGATASTSSSHPGSSSCWTTTVLAARCSPRWSAQDRHVGRVIGCRGKEEPEGDEVVVRHACRGEHRARGAAI